MTDPVPGGVDPQRAAGRRMLACGALAIGLWVVVSAAGVALVFDGAPSPEPSRADIGLMIGLTGLQNLAVLGLLLIPGILRPALGLRRAWLGAAFYVPFVFAWITAVAIYSAIVRSLELEIDMQRHLEWFVDPAGIPAAAGIAIVALVGPAAEELCFRGWIQPGLERFFGARAALWTTSILFGLIHGWLVALPITLLGFYFGWLRQRTGGIGAPIVAHVLHNSLTISLALLVPDVLQEAYR